MNLTIRKGVASDYFLLAYLLGKTTAAGQARATAGQADDRPRAD